MFWRRKPTPPTIRRLAGPDSAAVAAIYAEGFARPWSVTEVARMIADAAVVGEGAVSGGALAGFVLTRIAADEAEILAIAVAAKARGGGIASTLLAHHLGTLGMRGVARLFLEVEAENVAALALYRRFGFVEVGRRAAYYRKPDGSTANALVMRRDIG